MTRPSAGKKPFGLEPAPRRTRLSAAERRAQIIAGAREVFLEQGLIATRIRDIAERAGITEPFFYRFFSSKEQIYEEAVLQPLDDLVGALKEEAAAMTAKAAPFSRAQLQAVNAMILEFMEQTVPFLSVALFSEVGKGKAFYQEVLYPRLRDAIVDVVNALSGGRMTKFDPDVVFNCMFGVHFGVALDHMLRDLPIDIDHTAEQLTAMYAVGIRPSAGTNPAGKADAAAKATAGRRRTPKATKSR
ncbi:MAG: TetR/AcrR family transcriptional regulator [Acidimicrobiia bacterium]